MVSIASSFSATATLSRIVSQKRSVLPIMWSAVSIVQTASGLRDNATPAASAQAAAVSRPIGSPIMFSAGIVGSNSCIRVTSEAFVIMNTRSAGTNARALSTDDAISGFPVNIERVCLGCDELLRGQKRSPLPPAIITTNALSITNSLWFEN